MTDDRCISTVVCSCLENHRDENKRVAPHVNSYTSYDRTMTSHLRRFILSFHVNDAVMLNLIYGCGLRDVLVTSSLSAAAAAATGTSLYPGAEHRTGLMELAAINSGFYHQRHCCCCCCGRNTSSRCCGRSVSR